MKQFSVFVIAGLLLVAFSVPAMAKVNLSGAMWATYWAQKQSHSARSTDGASMDAYNVNQSASPKTFMVAQDMSGNGVQAHAVRGKGFLLAADCPLASDWVKAYGEFNAVNGGAVNMMEAWGQITFRKEAVLRVGYMEVPFGNEHNVRPDAGVEEVFVSEYSQDGYASLIERSDIGVSLFGTVLDNMLDYNVYAMNGSIANVADTNANVGTVTGPRAAGNVDNNDAKMVGVGLTLKPVKNLYLGMGAAFGDYATCANNAPKSTSFTAYDLNAGYNFADVLLLSAEFAATRHKEMLPQWNFDNGVINVGVTGPQDAKVHEYILKAIYGGIQNVELGVRFSVVDPKNIQSEDAAGYSDESKLSFAAGYEFARGASLKAEYSWLSTDRAYLDRYAAALARELNSDPDDDIFALQLGLQF